MAYNKRIKNFETFRVYMKEFSGFKTRTVYNTKMARSYDEHRRIESQLTDYMHSVQTVEGKIVSSVDNCSIHKKPFL